MNKDKFVIAYAPDDGYMNMTVVSMVSALENNKDKEIEFIILYSKLSETSFKKLKDVESRSNCKVRYIKMDESLFDNLPMSKWVTVQAWFRIKIPDLCPDLDKVLYLDCDTLVTDKLDDLFNLDLGENYVASVKDVWDVKKHLKRLKMNSNSYFNSGMLLINCEKFRKDNVFEKIKEYSIKYKKIIKFCDQDTLNKIIDTNKIDLHQKYNFMDTWWRNYYHEYEGQDLTNYEEAKKAPVIVHLTGLKPSVKGCKNMMTEKWWEYAKLTSVYDEILDTYNKSTPPVHKNKLLSQIFNIKNEYMNRDKWKVVTILGLKIKFSLVKGEQVFVIFNTAFIGDILLNNALVQNIKYFYPTSRVVFVVQPQFRDVALYQKGVDEVITFDKKKDNNLFGLIDFVRKFPYKNVFASFVIYSNDRNLILSKFIGSKHIITEPKGLLTDIIATPERYSRNQYIHKKDIATGLIESLTGRCFLNFPIRYEAPEISTKVIEKVKKLSKEKDLVAITATSKFKPKDIPLETTIDLIKLINDSGKTPILLGAGEVAKDYSKKLKRKGCKEFIDLIDKTNFVELANILKICKKSISVDTGTLHFANALDCPTVAVFYAAFKEWWAPQEGLYKAVTLQSPKSANEIFDELEKL